MATIVNTSRLVAHFIRDVRNDLSARRCHSSLECSVSMVRKTSTSAKPWPPRRRCLSFQGNVVAVDTGPFLGYGHRSRTTQAERIQRNRRHGSYAKEEWHARHRTKVGSFWQPIGKPCPTSEFGVSPQSDATETQGQTGRRIPTGGFRDVTLPADMENWFMPDFDDSKWTTARPRRQGCSGTTVESLSIASPQPGAKANSC